MDRRKWESLPDIIRRFILAWLSAATVTYLQLSETQRNLNGLDGLQEMSFLQIIMITAIVFVGLCLLSHRVKINTRKLECYGILIFFIILSLFALRASFSIPFLCAIVLISVLLGMYAIYGLNMEDCHTSYKPPKNTVALLFVIGFALLFFGFVSIWTVCRVLTYSTPSFDFGIFSQMFYQMKTTGLPNTTLERDGLLSHFQVHVSPIYYLLLPFYCLYPKPIMLQILQAAILASAVVPAWRLARKLGCKPFAAVLFCLMLLLYPAYSGGASYDLHENAFLTPLLLWLFYAIDCQKGGLTAVFCLLTLMVKEDAAVYVAVIALWLLLRSLFSKDHRQRFGVIAGVLLFAGSIIWFFLVTGYLAKYGDGVMTYRYSNFIYDGSSSLITVVKAAILSPMKVIYECVDPQKLSFIAITMLPLCGIPFITRRYERFILLIPYLLVNLMSDYKYQHDIFFQYTYGSTACLFYLTLVNYVDIASKIKQVYLKYLPLLLAVLISGTYFGTIIVPKAVRYPARYMNQKEYYKEMDTMLHTIPQDASVAATTFYTVPLSNRSVLYDVRYSSTEHLLSTEYVMLQMHDTSSYTSYAASEEDGYDNLVKLLEENGYQLLREMEDTMAIYWKPE